MSDATNEKTGHHKHRKHGKIVVFSGLVAASLGVAAVAIASDGERYWDHKGGYGGHHAQGMQHMFKKLDANGDGTITEAEAREVVASTLSNNDDNANGSLNLSEFEAVWMEHTRFKMVDAFQRLDEDGDGEVTEAELTAKRMAMMERADRNGDGSITKDELRFKHRKHHDNDDYEKDDD